MMNISKISKYQNVKIHYTNGWTYQFSISYNKFRTKIDDRIYKHVLIDNNKNETEILSSSVCSLERTIPYFIYDKIGKVYSGDGWFYSIKVESLFSREKDTKISHYLTKDSVVQQIPYFNSLQLIPNGLLEEWSIFNFIPPSHVGNKVLCASMITTLKSFSKKIGVRSWISALSEKQMKEISMMLAIKKLCE